MNKIILMGRLVRDPEVKYTQTGKVNATFTLAVDRPVFSKEAPKEADFIPVVIWGKQAEAVGNYLSKGQRALVEGRLQIRSYEAKDGSRKYVTEVIAERFEFVESRSQHGQTNNASPQTPAASNGSFESMGSASSDYEDIPF